MKHIIYDLAKAYPQIYLPIEEGIRQTEEYKNVVLRGEQSDREIMFSFNENDKLETFDTSVGQIRIITMYDRNDFEHMALCLGNHCEPQDIPASTGAMAIFGLNNWEKVRADIEDYKDSIILLSSGYYSNVNNDDVNKICKLNLTKDEWINKSITIRKFHELTHFIMRKKYPDDIKPLRDEIIADSIGILSAFNSTNKDMLKVFLGLESNEYRKGGRLQNYEGGQKENIPKVLEMIDEIDNKLNSLNSIDINYIFDNIDKLM